MVNSRDTHKKYMQEFRLHFFFFFFFRNLYLRSDLFWFCNILRGWHVYQMVAQKTWHVWNSNSSNFKLLSMLENCLKQIGSPYSLHMCISDYVLPSYVITMKEEILKAPPPYVAKTLEYPCTKRDINSVTAGYFSKYYDRNGSTIEH